MGKLPFMETIPVKYRYLHHVAVTAHHKIKLPTTKLERMRISALRGSLCERNGAAMRLMRRAGNFSIDRGIARCATMSTSGSASEDVTARRTSTESRQCISLYKYMDLEAEALPRWRQRILGDWQEMDVLGPVYIAQEGINAQVIVPVDRTHAFSHSFPAIVTPHQLNYGPMMDAASDQRCVVEEELAMAEVVTADVLGKCFQCGNDHTNCVMLQCVACRSALFGANREAYEDQVLKIRVVEDATKKQYRRRHAREWTRVAPNALTRLQRIHARTFTTSPADHPGNELDLNAYVQQASSPLSDEELLKELREKTQRDWPKAEQLIDEPQSKALSFLVQLTGAKDVLEVGCFTGYSAISLANGLLSNDGYVTTCDVNAETMAFARTFFDRSAKKDQIQSVVSDGMDFLEACAAQGRQFDLIFVDANKRQYINYFHTILEHKLLRPQGLLVFDNTLFRGRVLASANGQANKKERIAHGLAEFNEAISRDTRIVCVLLPLWDGMTLVRQRS